MDIKHRISLLYTIILFAWNCSCRTNFINIWGKAKVVQDLDFDSVAHLWRFKVAVSLDWLRWMFHVTNWWSVLNWVISRNLHKILGTRRWESKQNQLFKIIYIVHMWIIQLNYIITTFLPPLISENLNHIISKYILNGPSINLVRSSGRTEETEK